MKLSLKFNHEMINKKLIIISKTSDQVSNLILTIKKKKKTFIFLWLVQSFSFFLIISNNEKTTI